MIKAVRKGMACLFMAALVFQNTGVYAAAPKSPTVSVQPVTVQNATAEKSNGVVCKVDTNKNGTAELSKITKTTKKNVTVAAKLTVNGVSYTVTVIGAKAFENCTEMKSLTLPDTIKKISARAFTGAEKLEKIVLTSGSVIDFEEDAFKGLDTEKMTIEVSSDLSDEMFKEQKANLEKQDLRGL